MARLSIGSQYFQVKGDKARPVQDKYGSTTQANHQTSVVDDHIAQNKLLAMKNSSMALRITELELKIKSLTDENTILQQRNKEYLAGTHLILEPRILQIERTIVAKISEIFTLLQNVRSEEGLPENPLIKSAILVIAESLPPPITTSTPNTDNQASFLGQNAVSWAHKSPRSQSPNTELTLNSIADIAILEGHSSVELSKASKDTILTGVERAVSIHSDSNESNILSNIIENDESPEKKEAEQEKETFPSFKTYRQRNTSGPDQAKLVKPLGSNSHILVDPEQTFKNHGKNRAVGVELGDKATETKKTSTRKPLANITNRSRARLLRKAKLSVTRQEEIPDKEIFEFVEPAELEDEAKANSRRKRRHV